MLCIKPRHLEQWLEDYTIWFLNRIWVLNPGTLSSDSGLPHIVSKFDSGIGPRHQSSGSGLTHIKPRHPEQWLGDCPILFISLVYILNLVALSSGSGTTLRYFHIWVILCR